MNALSFFLSVHICPSLKYGFAHCCYACLRHPSKIASLKVEGWKQCARILNLGDCPAACIYGAKQNDYSPIAANG